MIKRTFEYLDLYPFFKIMYATDILMYSVKYTNRKV